MQQVKPEYIIVETDDRLTALIKLLAQKGYLTDDEVTMLNKLKPLPY